MKLEGLIAKGIQASVYRDQETAVKVFEADFPKAEVFNEALNTSRVEDIEGLHVPKILEVSSIDGKWAIAKEYISGKTLHQLMIENPGCMEEYMERMVALQLEIHSKQCPLLPKLKDKMSRQIRSLEVLSEVQEYEMLTRLDGMPKHTKLCHGDFNPRNIIVHGEEYYVVDWVHATQGNASADAARTYLLFYLDDRERAEMYLDLFCEKSGTDKRYVQSWMPLVAAAQLTKNRPVEKDFLIQWLDVVDYQ